jgi:hypothetical protein
MGAAKAMDRKADHGDNFSYYYFIIKQLTLSVNPITVRPTISKPK